MNSVCITGYVLNDAHEACTTGGIYKLVCDVMVDAGDGRHVPYRCEFITAGLILKARPYLTSGRPFIFQAVLDGHPVVDRGVQKGWSRYLRVIHAEFPARTLTKGDEKTAA